MTYIIQTDKRNFDLSKTEDQYKYIFEHIKTDNNLVLQCLEKLYIGAKENETRKWQEYFKKHDEFTPINKNNII